MRKQSGVKHRNKLSWYLVLSPRFDIVAERSDDGFCLYETTCEVARTQAYTKREAISNCVKSWARRGSRYIDGNPFTGVVAQVTEERHLSGVEIIEGDKNGRAI